MLKMSSLRSERVRCTASPVDPASTIPRTPERARRRVYFDCRRRLSPERCGEVEMGTEGVKKVGAGT